jgi:tellurite resistance protein
MSSREVDEAAFLSVIRVWAAMAWADGQLLPVETDALRRLIGAASMSDGDRATALGFLEHRVDLDADGLAGLDAGQRRGIYRAAVRLAFIDRSVAPEEKALLDRLARALDLETASVRDIERAVLEAPPGPR